ncbi:MAG: acyl-CoA dehydrogenase family protein [Candidatus Binatia bacterium]|nr:acyl-CoA dehydrogenase family protein [Candidatus Binatia bacterium]
MDFRFSEEEERFRREIQDFIKQELPPDWVGYGILGEVDTEEEWEFSRSMTRKLGAKGWLAIGWPKEYGGLGASHIMQVILSEEINYHEAPGWDFFGIGMLGPTLMVHGTEKQKRRYLGEIARGETLWCQGFSEPGAGSDLAALQTKAVSEGDNFIVNGQKLWNSNAHRADWCFFLARTDPNAPKHKGISFILVDMKTPGITVRPLVNIAGGHSFNEIYFDDVKVPKENLVGELNRGWYVAQTLLGVERSGVHRIAMARRNVDRLLDYARETGAGQDPLVRQKLTQLYTEGETARLLAYRVAWMQSREMTVPYEASVSRLFGAEFCQRVSRIGMEILGLYGILEKDAKWTRLAGKIGNDYLATVGATLAAGTSEIQRNIIAQRGLGLPR